MYEHTYVCGCKHYIFHVCMHLVYACKHVCVIIYHAYVQNVCLEKHYCALLGSNVHKFVLAQTVCLCIYPMYV